MGPIGGIGGACPVGARPAPALPNVNYKDELQIDW